MTMPPFPEDALELPDYDLGGLLLAWFVMAQAEDVGLPIDRIPEEFAERVRQYVLTIETVTAKNAAVEKALHKAASGDFEAAGKFLREHMLSCAVALKFIPMGLKSHQGPKQRAKDKDIVAFQEAAKPLFVANGFNIAKTLKEPELAEYVRKHYGEHTLRDALKKIKPKGAGPRGRPRKGNVIP